MAFESLTDRLAGVFKKLRGHGKLTEADIKTAMREVRMALLEADVNYKVAKDFCAKVSERAMGQEVMESLTPAQQVVKIVNEELVALMGGSEAARLNLKNKGQNVIMLCGLQGNGKTTHAAKLAKYFIKQGRRPMLVACDIYRPAAIDQLQVVGKQAGAPVFTLPGAKPPEIARKALAHAKDYGNDIVILDTAGRLQIDEVLMQELVDIKEAVPVDETLLVVDAMAGQDAVNVAQDLQRDGGRGWHHPHQDRRRHPRRCSPVGAGRHRQAHQVPGYRREAGRSGCVPSGPHGQPHSGHGRCAEPDRTGTGCRR